jgi:predicted RNA-binding protein with PIN domain
VTVGETVRVPGSYCGTKYGQIIAAYSDQKAVLVRMSYGSRWKNVAYLIADLEAEAEAHRQLRRDQRKKNSALTQRGR